MFSLSFRVDSLHVLAGFSIYMNCLFSALMNYVDSVVRFNLHSCTVVGHSGLF